MTDSLIAAELVRERDEHRLTKVMLEAERTAHAETRLAGLALIEAANLHMNQLRDAVETCQKAQEPPA